MCDHKWLCTNSRRRIGYRSRRYKCSLCGLKKSSIEIDLQDGDDHATMRVSLAKRLSSICLEHYGSMAQDCLVPDLTKVDL